MEGLKIKKYLQITRKRFDPLALVFSFTGLIIVVIATGVIADPKKLLDLRSIAIVFGGTIASILFQFDFSTTFRTMILIFRSFLGTPEKPVIRVVKELDRAILKDKQLSDLREGKELSGELLNDIVYMSQQKLLFDEIDAFVTSRVSDEFLERKIAVNLLNRAAIIAPSLGLFGTVIGLIGLLSSLSNPAQIGPSMALALMTTAYGAGLGSLIFTPLAGRIEHHNEIYIEVHKQILSKVGILLNREERQFDSETLPDASGF